MSKKLFKIAVPIAAGFLGGPLGSAIGLGSGALGQIGGGALAGGLGSALTGSNPLQGALMAGASAGFNSLIGGAGGGGILGDVFGSAGKPAGLDAATGITWNNARPATGLGSILGSGGGGAMSSYASPLLSAALGSYSNDSAEDALLKQQRKNQDLIRPFLDAGFEPGDLTKDPGYQFQLQEGNRALDRQQAARGNFFSGDAIRAGQEFGQGLASTTYTDAYNRFLQGQQQKLGAAGALAGINTDIGNIKANSIMNTGNLLSGAGAGIFGGNAFSNTGGLLNNSNGDYLTQLLKLKQMGLA